MTQEENAMFTADLSNPDLLLNGQIALRHEQIHLHRLKFVWDGACYERLLIRNFSDRMWRIRVALQFGSDFADLFEVRGERRRARGDLSVTRDSDRRAALHYTGLDKIERITTLDFDPAPQTRTAARPPFHTALHSRQVRRIFIRVGIADPGAGRWSWGVFERCMRGARDRLREFSA